MNSQIQYMCQLLPYEKYTKKTKPTQKHIYLTSKKKQNAKTGLRQVWRK